MLPKIDILHLFHQKRPWTNLNSLAQRSYCGRNQLWHFCDRLIVVNSVWIRILHTCPLATAVFDNVSSVLVVEVIFLRWFVSLCVGLRNVIRTRNRRCEFGVSSVRACVRDSWICRTGICRTGKWRTGVEQEQTYAFKVKPVLFEGTVWSTALTPRFSTQVSSKHVSVKDGGENCPANTPTVPTTTTTTPSSWHRLLPARRPQRRCQERQLMQAHHYGVAKCVC